MYGIRKISQVLEDGLAEGLSQHHENYRLPCFGEYLEEQVHLAFSRTGLSTDWEPDRSHRISVDMTLDSGETISIKSGDYNVSQRKLKFSGSRLGQHSTIEEMLHAIEANSADYYVSIARIKKDWTPVPNLRDKKIYYLFVFESQRLGYAENSWIKQETRSGGFNYSMTGHGVEAQIRASMSYQLWTVASEIVTDKPARITV
jgi:hypothetical protein